MPTHPSSGPVTLRISGAQFGFATVFQLRQGGTVLAATRTLLQDSATAFATFDLTGRAVVYTTHKEKAELKRDQVLAYGPDPRMDISKGPLGCYIEPAPTD